MKKTIKERFWNKVDIRGQDECWPWKTGKLKDGYGHFHWNGKDITAHRMAWILTNGPLPQDQVVRHFRCDNPICCNPKHLKPGTQMDNAWDRVFHGRQVSPIGEGSAQAKITAKQAVEIYDQKNSGIPAQKIASHFGVSDKQVYAIWSGRSWSDFTGASKKSRSKRKSDERERKIKLYQANNS